MLPRSEPSRGFLWRSAAVVWFPDPLARDVRLLEPRRRHYRSDITMALVFSEPAAEIAFGATVGIWALGERILTLRDLRLGAWKGRQDRGSYLWVLGGVVAGFVSPSPSPPVGPCPCPPPWCGSS